MNQQIYEKIQRLREDIPEDAVGTKTYPLVPLQIVAEELETVPDLIKGGERTKRWCAIFTISVSNSFSEGPKQGCMFPPTPCELIDSDTKEALRARLIHEIDVALKVQEELLTPKS